MIYDKRLEEKNRRVRNSFHLTALNVLPDGLEFYTETDSWGFDENSVFLPRSNTYAPHHVPPYMHHTRQLDTQRLIYRGPETK